MEEYNGTMLGLSTSLTMNNKPAAPAAGVDEYDELKKAYVSKLEKWERPNQQKLFHL
jgi:hypothetical protein